MKAYERLLRYAQIHSSSKTRTGRTPSTERQRRFAERLEQEMTALGLSEVATDENAYVYGRLPATEGMEQEPVIALIAHMDTVPDSDFPGENVKPQQILNYDGGDVPLGESGRVLSPAMFPELRKCIGQTLIVTDGTTVLGADDKAGIAEILTACEEIQRENLPHGTVAVCFTPDEEIGHGASLLDLKRLGADWAYTVDGSGVAELNIETFNAAEARVRFFGVNVHPGEAKNKMRNANLLAMEFHAMLPAAEQPALTEGYEGFYHLTGLSGTVEEAKARYIVRDHNPQAFEARLQTLRHAEKTMNERYGKGTVVLTVRQQYRNMKEVLDRCPEAVQRAENAIRQVGLEPQYVPIRGGTDGSQLSFRGLPCPNLGTGGEGYHGPYEHITAENMELAVRVLKNLVSRTDEAAVS